MPEVQAFSNIGTSERTVERFVMNVGYLKLTKRTPSARKCYSVMSSECTTDKRSKFEGTDNTSSAADSGFTDCKDSKSSQDTRTSFAN